MAIAWSGRPSTLYGSTSRSQSIRLTESHCLSLPFWYRASIRSRPSPYSQLNRADPASGTAHRSSGTGLVYSSWVDITAPLWTAGDATVRRRRVCVPPRRVLVAYLMGGLSREAGHALTLTCRGDPQGGPERADPACFRSSRGLAPRLVGHG